MSTSSIDFDKPIEVIDDGKWYDAKVLDTSFNGGDGTVRVVAKYNDGKEDRLAVVHLDGLRAYGPSAKGHTVIVRNKVRRGYINVYPDYAVIYMTKPYADLTRDERRWKHTIEVDLDTGDSRIVDAAK